MKNIFTSKIAIVLMVIVALIVIGGGFAYYKHRTCSGDYQGYAGARMLDKLDDELDLSDRQRVQIKALIDETFAQMRQQRRGSMRDEVKALMMRPNISAAEVRSLMDARWPGWPRQADMRNFVAKQIAAVHSILTPAQRAEIAEHADEWSHRGDGHRRGRHRGNHW